MVLLCFGPIGVHEHSFGLALLDGKGDFYFGRVLAYFQFEGRLVQCRFWFLYFFENFLIMAFAFDFRFFLPFLIVEWASVTCLHPPRDAMEVIGVVANAYCGLALLMDWYL